MSIWYAGRKLHNCSGGSWYLALKILYIDCSTYSVTSVPSLTILLSLPPHDNINIRSIKVQTLSYHYTFRVPYYTDSKVWVMSGGCNKPALLALCGCGSCLPDIISPSSHCLSYSWNDDRVCSFIILSGISELVNFCIVNSGYIRPMFRSHSKLLGGHVCSTVLDHVCWAFCAYGFDWLHSWPCPPITWWYTSVASTKVVIPEMLESTLERKALHGKLQHDSIWEIWNTVTFAQNWQK